jgi:nitrite reductase (NADH) large subunit
MKKSRLVMVGNGMAGVRTLEELLKIAPGLHEITVFGAEPHPNYNRIMLSPVLAGEQRWDEIILNDWSWYAQHGITLHAGCRVHAVDRARRVVHAVDASGQPVSAGYDRLILATGSRPFMLPVPGRELEGVLGYRDIADTRAMIAAAASHRQAVVIGGGLLGLEAANGLMKRGMEVTVVHAGERLLDRQLDETAAALLQASLAERGMRFLMQAQTRALTGDGQGRVAQVHLQDGRSAPASLVVMAVGIRPETTLAEQMRLHVQRGIVVSDTLQTVTDPRIYGAWPTAWWSRCSSRARCWPTTWPRWASAAIRARRHRPSSRSRASTCSAQATFAAMKARRKSCSATPAQACTASWCCGVTGW